MTTKLVALVLLAAVIRQNLIRPTFTTVQREPTRWSLSRFKAGRATPSAARLGPG